MSKSAVEALIASITLSPLAAVVTDPSKADNPIIAVNSAFEALTGYQKAELVGVNCRILAGQDTNPAASKRLRQAVEAGASTFVELINYRKNGSKFLNAVMIAPIVDESGWPILFVGTQMEVGAAGSVERSNAVASISLLTPKQRSVLQLMARGMRNKAIAAELGLTEKTIKMHRVAMVRRLRLASTMEAVRLAVQADL